MFDCIKGFICPKIRHLIVGIWRVESSSTVFRLLSERDAVLVGALALRFAKADHPSHAPARRLESLGALKDAGCFSCHEQSGQEACLG